MRTRVLIVEDSPVMQRLLADLIGRDPGLEVAGIAGDPYEARELVKALRPDVMTLDVEMPRMDGLTFLERLMRLHPMPVVMVSSLTERDAEASLRALELGAVDVICKPRGADVQGLTEFGASIAESLRAAARADLGARAAPRPAAARTLEGPADRRLLEGQLIAIGASTGGTEAIREILVRLPANTPPVVIVQHMPEMFTRMFAKRLDEQCTLSVCEVADRQRLEPGHAYVAPGNFHLAVKRAGKAFEARVDQGVPVNRHRPSVDVLFDSVAALAAQATAVILTGMGGDGAAGMRRIRAAGGLTLAQDEASCVVFGMPKTAIEAGAVDHVLPLDALAERIMARVREPSR
jgi:two-component system chemotaxis response regulator CheB